MATRTTLDRGKCTAVLLCEFTKLRTVRSTAWTLFTACAVTVLLALCFSLLSRYATGQLASQESAGIAEDPVFTSFAGMVLGQLAMIVFGVLAVSGEYSSGLISTSLQAVPRRGLLLGCKAAVVGGAALVTGLVTSFTSYAVGQAALGPHGTSLAEPGVLRAVFGAGLYMALLAVFAMGAATVLRSSLLALGLLMPFFFLVSPLLGSLPKTKAVAQYLPDAAGMRIAQVEELPGALGPWSGLGVLVLWTAAALVGGVVALRSRDAR
ncbi:ABC transporter permease subunit [Streptomyces sp. NPDC006879]|uniref:ABC transporter permease subunit n=1 Tax=Streptomyces sp. NPDC006879 TaxID=3364767 RepID=UPI0036847C60